MSEVVDEIEELFAQFGNSSYGENVTLLQHSLQTAAAAAKFGADDALVAACLLHDIGHMVQEADDEYGVHDHGAASRDYLAARFGPDVSQPAALHVDAKRYLCAIEPNYYEILSPASRHTLEKQGGSMSPEQQATFEAEPHHLNATQLRRWEDGPGKAGDQQVPPLSHYRSLLERLSSD